MCLFPSFTNGKALSAELAGYFPLAINEKGNVLHIFQRTNEKYHDWGAYAKCNALPTFVQTTLDSMLNAVDFDQLMCTGTREVPIDICT